MNFTTFEWLLSQLQLHESLDSSKVKILRRTIEDAVKEEREVCAVAAESAMRKRAMLIREPGLQNAAEVVGSIIRARGIS